MDHRCGMTLVEMLVAMLLLSIFCLMLATLAGLGRVKEKPFSEKEMGRVLENFRRDVCQAVVRTNVHRYMNFYLNQSSTNAVIYFTKFENHTDSLKNLSFVNHIAYQWDGAKLYRASVTRGNKPPENSPTSQNVFANAQRLQIMTPAYSGAPYDWHSYMHLALENEKNSPVLDDVTSFRLECFTSNNASQISWNDAQSLPTSARLFIQQGGDASPREIWIPFIYSGVIDNSPTPFTP